MILSDGSIIQLLNDGLLVDMPDPMLVNPASLDLRIGYKMLVEIDRDKWQEVNLGRFTEQWPFLLPPGTFALVATAERIKLPRNIAMDLRLKSSSARKGFDHSLAFWFDPGWDGNGTMEIRNVTRYQHLPLYYGMRFAQMIFHMLDKPALTPYAGRYQGASTVEHAKPAVNTASS